MNQKEEVENLHPDLLGDKDWRSGISLAAYEKLYNLAKDQANELEQIRPAESHQEQDVSDTSNESIPEAAFLAGARGLKGRPVHPHETEEESLAADARAVIEAAAPIIKAAEKKKIKQRLEDNRIAHNRFALSPAAPYNEVVDDCIAAIDPEEK